MPEVGYARPELLADPAWVIAHSHDPSVVVIDCGSDEAYARAHIPGAVHLPVHYYIKEESGVHVMGPTEFAGLMGGLGVGDDTTVVAYGAGANSGGARLWWALNYYGHTQAKVLDGGWDRWIEEGRPVTKRTSTPTPSTFTSTVHDELICRLDDLKARVGRPDTVILDVRSDEEWTGANDRDNRHGGHVPGAVHLEYLNFVTNDERHTFRPAGELRALLDQAGVTPESEVVTY